VQAHLHTQYIKIEKASQHGRGGVVLHGTTLGHQPQQVEVAATEHVQPHLQICLKSVITV
jgi:hypothetical protein